MHWMQPKIIKPCPRGAETCALPLFRDHECEINPIILKLKGDRDIPKMYSHTENEAANLSIQNLELEHMYYYEKIFQSILSNFRPVVFELHATTFLLPNLGPMTLNGRVSE